MTANNEALLELSRVHEAIRHYVDETMKDVGDLDVISSACTGQFDEKQCKSVSDRQFSLRQNLQFLHKGLEDHHDRETALLNPMIGAALARSVDRECNEITSLFDEATDILKNAELAEMSPEDLAEVTKKAKQATDKLAERVASHSRNIDTLISMLKDAV